MALALLLAAAGSPPPGALEAPEPAPESETEAEEVCAEVEAYSVKLGRAERKQRIEEAKHDALTRMAEKVWSDAFLPQRDSAGRLLERNPPETAARIPASTSASATLRSRYGVRQRLAGGRFVTTGDKAQRTVAYCLPAGSYRAVRDSLRADRSGVMDSLRTRFARLESMIESGVPEVASRDLAALRVDVVTEALEYADYHSAIQDRTRSFGAWLIEWGDVVPRGPELVGDLIARAIDLTEQGKLAEADRYVAEALEIDRTDREAQELRIRIQERRNAQLEMLRHAGELATEGRYAVAEQKLETARALDTSDAELLERVEKTVDSLHAADLAYNPPRRVSVFTTIGTLGVDTGRIERRVFEDTGLSADASKPFSLGAGGSFRVGRKMLIGVTASWGFSEAKNFMVGDVPMGLFEVFQLTAGAGLATRRGPKRSFSYQVTGGIVWERADVDGFFTGDRDDSGDQTAFYVRFAAERKNLTLFLQHGLGFDDVEGSLIGWSNKTQIGVGGVF
jgi:hypothetical protein